MEESLFSWLHISDLHFGQPHRDPLKLIRDQLLRAAQEHDLYGIPPPDAIFVTGDVTYSGASEDYAQATTWLKLMGMPWRLGPDSIFVVPGNHDIQRDVVEPDGPLSSILTALRETVAGNTWNLFANNDTRVNLMSRLANYLTFSASFAHSS